ncbi:MAG: hypothetical protein KAI24_03625, partial [Planctomycetes bacterium]|nr:hypothetical protein [Planctomycetota bacterium]
PGLGSLLLGLVRSIDIDVRAVAYPSEQDGFARKPKWRRTVTLRVPPLLSLLSQQEELLQRFTNMINEVRVSARGSFTGEGAQDLVIVRDEDQVAELYRDVPPAPELDSKEGVKVLRRLLFEDEDTVFDIDRVFGLLSGFLSKLSQEPDGERKPNLELPLRDKQQWRLILLENAELDGEPGDELVAGYESAEGFPVRAYDVIRWR